jgi:hypothetical protein
MPLGKTIYQARHALLQSSDEIDKSDGVWCKIPTIIFRINFTTTEKLINMMMKNSNIWYYSILLFFTSLCFSGFWA